MVCNTDSDLNYLFGHGHVNNDGTPVRPGDPTLEWDRAGMGPCEKCHTVEAEIQYLEILVCGTCRASFPAIPPWRVCPESGEAIDTNTGKPFVFDASDVTR